MANYLNKLIDDDFVWVAISSALTGRLKRAKTGYVRINCPMCTTRGHPRPDTRHRGGVKNTNPGLVINCFNCGFVAIWKPGELISQNLREFMEQIGVPSSTISKVRHRAFSYRRLVEVNPEAQAMLPTNFALDFPVRSLPEGAKTFSEWANLGCVEQDFIDAVTYLHGRGEDIANHTFYWSPIAGDNNMRRRVIIPCYQRRDIVGWTSRLIDTPRQIGEHTEPRYYSDLPTDFLFNNHLMMDREREYIVLVEGPLDALAIDGVATLGARLSDRQASWIDGMAKTVIVLPDRDLKGDHMMKIALDRGWHVSLPLVKSGSSLNWWDDGIKDAAEAVQRHGRLYTITSILKSSTKNPVEISIRRSMLKQGII